MDLIAVDDKKPVLRQIEETIREAVPECSLQGFVSAGDALSYATGKMIDIAFLDIEMGEMNGLELAQRLKGIYKRTNIIFLTGYAEYAIESYDACASDYLLKPVSVKRVQSAITRLRNPITGSASRIRIQTFGNFTVFVDEVPLLITFSKSKELLALLVDKRGTAVTMKQAASILWENKNYNRSLMKQTQSAVSNLIRILNSVNAGHIIIKGWNSVAADVGKFECDYYRLLERKPDAVNTFTGEYMSEYSWAEMTAGMLTLRDKD